MQWVRLFFVRIPNIFDNFGVAIHVSLDKIISIWSRQFGRFIVASAVGLTLSDPLLTEFPSVRYLRLTILFTHHSVVKYWCSLKDYVQFWWRLCVSESWCILMWPVSGNIFNITSDGSFVCDWIYSIYTGRTVCRLIFISYRCTAELVWNKFQC